MPPQKHQEFVEDTAEDVIIFDHDGMTEPYYGHELDTVNFPDLLGLDTDMQGGDSSGTDETVPSSASSLEVSDVSQVAAENAPGDMVLYNVILSLLRRPDAERTEIPHDQCSAFDSTPYGPEHTCSLFTKGAPCNHKVHRTDRFKHHIQWHLGIRPYPCAGSKKVKSPCHLYFSSIALRDKHVGNKDKVPCVCSTPVLPSNLARHRRGCSAYQASL